MSTGRTGPIHAESGSVANGVANCWFVSSNRNCVCITGEYATNIRTAARNAAAPYAIQAGLLLFPTGRIFGGAGAAFLLTSDSRFLAPFLLILPQTLEVIFQYR